MATHRGTADSLTAAGVFPSMFTTLLPYLAYLSVGAIAGVLAGLLGVGGGLIIVPMLMFCFTRLGLPPDSMMHLAVATSTASIAFTSLSSFLSHHKRGAVAWAAVRRITPGILVGTFCGTFVASRLSTHGLKAFFCVFLAYVVGQMLLDKKPQPSRELPGALGMTCVGGVIGLVSSLVGIGGGVVSVPFLLWCNLPGHRAIGTSAAFGFPIAIGGSLGYLVNGWQAVALPPGSVGFVYLPALVCIVSASVLTAPLGVRLAHRLPVTRLKRVFAALLIVVGVRMVWSLF
jgi:uncharacterized protein